MKKDLIHFVRWEKIPEEQVEPVMESMPRWGVSDIVASPFWFREQGENYVAKIAKLMERCGLRSSACHALWNIGNDCIQPDAESWRTMIRRHTRFLDQLSCLNVTTYTMHLGYDDATGNLEKDFAMVRKTVDALLPVLERNRVTLALENSAEPLYVIEKLAETVRGYRSEWVGMCFDNGHANCYQKGVEKTLRIMSDGIVTCHLHDNFGEHDDHNPPGDGNVDWKRLTALLDGLPRLHHAETESGDWSQDSWNRFRSATASA